MSEIVNGESAVRPGKVSAYGAFLVSRYGERLLGKCVAETLCRFFAVKTVFTFDSVAEEYGIAAFSFLLTGWSGCFKFAFLRCSYPALPLKGFTFLTQRRQINIRVFRRRVGRLEYLHVN